MNARIARFALIAAMFAALIGSAVKVSASNIQYGDLVNVELITYEDQSQAIEADLTLENGTTIAVSMPEQYNNMVCFASLRGNACSVAYTYDENTMRGEILGDDENLNIPFMRLFFGTPEQYTMFLPIVSK
jgi:hypothetical protein